jgi:protein-disulfide isomerase
VTEPAKAVAVVAGEPVSESELLARVDSELTQLRQQEYEIKSRALENLINQKLLAAEAKRRSLTTEQLVQEEVDKNVGAPSDAEMKARYDLLKARINRPFEEVKEQLRTAMIQSKRQEVMQAYVKGLRARASVRILLDPPRVQVGIDKARFRGNPNAPVMLVEFSDYQCPFCSRIQSTLNDLVAKYGDKLGHTYRDFPLREIHPDAQAAAEASRCAGDQGKFWPYHDLLFANRSKLDTASLKKYARDAALDAESFDACLASGKYAPEVAKDFEDGQQAGVSGTPGFFINGIFLNGARPAADFERIIEAELERAQNRGAGQD